MIELVQSPDTNRVIADGNDTLIMVRGNASQNYFTRAEIFINGSSFLTQGWSKDEDGLSTFNLKHLYYAYFENQFSEEINTGFYPKQDLLKTVKIELREYAVGATTPVHTLELPQFQIIKNHKPAVFNDLQTVSFLGLPQENIKVARGKGYIFPLYLKANDLLTVDVLNSLGNVIYTETLENYPNQVTQYELSFLDVDLSAHDAVYVRFSTAQDQVQKKLVFIKENSYPTKQIFYLNNFGFYCVAYLLGIREESNILSPMSYAQFDGSEVNYDVEDTRELRLNSGHGYKDITRLIHAIATSLDVRIKLEDFWERVKSETKEVQGLVDNQFIYSEVLQFSRINLANFTNENTYAIVPEVANITKAGDENQPLVITKAEFLNNYTATQSATRLRLREVPVNGKLSFETSEGVFNLSDMADNDPNILPFTIDLADFVSITYEPAYMQDGYPLDELDFQMAAQVLWSNIGTITLNINDVPDEDMPPSIVVNSIQRVALDVDNNASKLIDATISHPVDPVTILWEVLGGAPITFDDNSIEKPTITLTGASPTASYQVKVTATNTQNNLTAERTVNIEPSSFAVMIEKTEDAPAFNSRTGQFNISGGEPNSTITMKRTVSAYDFSQYVMYNKDLPSEEILVTQIDEITATLDANGELVIPIQIQSNSSITTFITLEIIEVAGAQIIDANNFEETISYTFSN